MQRTVYPVWSGELTYAIIHKSKAKCKPWGMACRLKWNIFYPSHKLEVCGKWWNIIEMSVFRCKSSLWKRVLRLLNTWLKTEIFITVLSL